MDQVVLFAGPLTTGYRSHLSLSGGVDAVSICFHKGEIIKPSLYRGKRNHRKRPVCGHCLEAISRWINETFDEYDGMSILEVYKTIRRSKKLLQFPVRVGGQDASAAGGA